jgi:hypothetical protein
MTIFKNPGVREAIYGVAVAVFTLLGILGWMNGQQIEGTLSLVTALINLMAALNTPTKRRVAKKAVADEVPS